MRIRIKLMVKNVLIIEDEQSILRLLSDELKRGGYGVTTAMDGVAGLEKALSEHPDIILLDIIMPKMDGITMLKKLREQDDWGKIVPVIILSNLGDSSHIFDSLQQGVHDYLVKSDW